jgi:hypothetical protein
MVRKYFPYTNKVSAVTAIPLAPFNFTASKNPEKTPALITLIILPSCLALRAEYKENMVKTRINESSVAILEKVEINPSSEKSAPPKNAVRVHPPSSFTIPITHIIEIRLRPVGTIRQPSALSPKKYIPAPISSFPRGGWS